MKNKGSTILVTPIIWTITLFIFLFFIVMSVRIMEPFLLYQKISETALKYIFVMEEFGYLNSADQNSLKDDLVKKGLNINNVILNATDSSVDYGEIVELNITYRHPYKKSVFSKSISPTYEEEFIDINVRKVGVSKR